MGKKIPRNRSKTLPSSPTHSFSSSSSSSDFEFRISVSPRKSSPAICPADELFYKGQLLPLHLSPRISMVRSLLLASSSTSSSSATATTASRDSSSSTDSTSSSLLAAADLSLLAAGEPCCDSSRPSSVADDDDPLKRLTAGGKRPPSSSKYFSLSRIFKKDPAKIADGNSAGKKTSSSSTAKEVIRKYLKKVKPLYEKLSSTSTQKRESTTAAGGISGCGPARTASSDLEQRREINTIAAAAAAGGISGATTTTTFSGNLKCGKIIKRRCVASCPSSMRSSPSHSGVLNRAGLPVGPGCRYGTGPALSSETSTMEELQNAIQGAIAHCKNSMLQQNSSSFNNNHHNNKGKAIQIA